MTEHRPRIFGHIGRWKWGGIALLLLLALAWSFLFSGSSVTRAENEAEERAATWSSTVVETQLAPDLVGRDLYGTTYRDLTVRVQAGILSDDRVAVVRIWRIDGALIYSTAQRDDVAEVVAENDPALEQALAGDTVSVRSGDGTHHEGLKRAGDELYQTFIPVHLENDEVVDAVVEIDQRYSAIRGQAMRVWRPVQFGLLLLIVAALVMLGRSLFGVVTGRSAIGGPSARTEQRAERAIRDAEQRAQKAEESARDAEDRMKELERRSKETPSPDPAEAERLEELELRLRASEAEREQRMGELQRLRSALAEREAELALARAGASGTKAETKRVSKLVADAERKAAEADKKVSEAERKVEESSKRATMSAERAFEMEAQLRTAEQKSAQADQRAAQADQRAAQAELTLAQAEQKLVHAGVADAEAAAKRREEDRKVAAELKKAEDERNLLLAKVDELEKSLAAANDKVVAAHRELAVKELEINTTSGAAAAATLLEERAVTAEVRLADSEERVTDAHNRLAEAEAKLEGALAKLNQLERARTTHEPRASDGFRPEPASSLAGMGPGHLEHRIAELERARRDDVVQLQRAQESFANAQVELANANRKLRDAETRISELEHGGPPKTARVAQPRETKEVVAPEVPVPAYVTAASAPDLATTEAGRRSELSSFDDFAADVSPPSPPDRMPEQAVEHPEEELEEEGLSLRERLARAAAARRRGPLS